MIVTLDEVGEVLERAENLGKDTLEQWLREAGETDWSAGGDGTFRAHFTRAGKKVVLKADAVLPLTTQCSRCLKEIRWDLKLDFTTIFTSAPVSEPSARAEGPQKVQDESGTGASFDLDSAEEEPFDGRTINTDGVLAEQLLLGLPMSALCSESCKGLCSVCGADLNDGDCGCERKPMDPRWAALKSIKITPGK